MPKHLADFCYDLTQLNAYVMQNGQIFPVSQYGIKLILTPMTGGNFNWVPNAATNAGWFISSQTTNAKGKEEFLLEPDYTAHPALGRFLYHVTPVGNVSSVLTNGIQLRTGGTTFLGRSYPPRSHHALTLWDAMCFLDSHATNAPSVGGPGLLPLKQLNDYEIIEFAPPTGVEFWIDAWMTGACWTDKLIPPGIVSVSVGWKKRYLDVAKWR